jgi:putative tricarboxylic transport membrane protein
MSTSGRKLPFSGPLDWSLLARKDVLAGLLFMTVGVLGLIISHGYPIGTALRMGTGYVPRLLCWLLIGLGALVLLQGLRDARAQTIFDGHSLPAWRPVIFVAASLAIFAVTVERLGLVIAILLLTGIGGIAARGLKPIETAIAALVLIVLSWAIFIVGLGLTIPVWPDL